MISDSSKKEEARKFIDVLMGADGQAILKKYGFVSVQ
jgi:ABC-type molybdate transport system substrate-binding protein